MEGQGQVGAYGGLEGGTAAAQRARGLGNGVCCGSWTGCRLTLGSSALGPSSRPFPTLPGSLLPTPARGVPQL